MCKTRSLSIWSKIEINRYPRPSGWEISSHAIYLGVFVFGGYSRKLFSSINPFDKGGWSYGKYQIATNTGTMNQYLKTSKYKNELKGLKPGTKEFNKKWEEIAKRDPKGFAEDQHKFIQKTHYEKQMNLLKKNGIDLSNRGPAIQDLVWSSSVQHGGNTSLIQRALKGKDVSRMSNDQIIDEVQSQRKKSYIANYGKNKNILNGLLRREKDERRSLHQLEAKSKQRKENL